MPSLKDLRNRIASVKATQKITKAMQMVASAKLRRAQLAAEAARPYAERMDEVLASLASIVGTGPDAPKLLAGNGYDRTHLLVVCTAERGLCGGFNASIARLARDTAEKLIAEGKKVKILCVGKKGYDLLKRQFGEQILELIELRSVRTIGFVNAEAIGRKILNLYKDAEFDVCTLFFAKFRTVLHQIPTAQQLIPLAVKTQEDAPAAPPSLYEYEPSEEQILATLLPRNITIQVLRALLENAASEQGARMSAMDNASRNAGEMIKKQTLKYNRSRQAMITKELIEIISGAEAL
ncbi:F0F1 ATP synthase subunit gamma [Beijerinckia indica]|uniref:ATP synthase gamma chain n=1 Tax=Beijerinckia indica subsp. indica (strain ATCC 9039 / DSM 1715 / NCIMB 8712) TaxID=395963 RepID=ATPG_BEII9|nr:F0F1 ATP synthase subunit gamma [Beijerinckia indica]B2ICI6.1 RecName: Full=ATP synthase gamma chain; AltName: Full=ATP synthase F1 sector gamma subunit; AltName: Full=F-ATPase gamma subunit [Beijerinckia indica subsp. indica ATCC 9039]ACB93875.1 ATP synthase F1, gamma subunit [Beijerinckia indica subsp. indica ATCC 9039]